MASTKFQKKSTARYKKEKKGKSCAFKAVMAFAVIIILSAIAIAICTSVISDTTKNLERAAYPKEYTQYVEKYAREYKVDENLIYAVIDTESNFNEEAVSPVGAVGLMQIMPETFDWLLEIQGRQGEYSHEDLFSPDVNIEFGTYYLSMLLDSFESEGTAVAAYNAGQGKVSQWLADTQYSSDGVSLDYIPYDETANYVNKVLYAKSKYESLY